MGDDPSSDRDERAVAGKWLAGLFSITMIGVVLSPIVENWRSDPEDSFPLSYYRMFSEPRRDMQRINYLVGFDAQRNRYLIPYTFAGTGGMNQVRRQINRLVEQRQAAGLCQTVASNIARRRTGRFTNITTVEITTGTYPLSAYFTGNKAPVSERVRAACQVRRDRR